MATLKAGELRHLLTITAPAGTLAEDAQDVATHVPAAIAVLPLAFQAREYQALGGLQTSTLYTVRVRYREDLKASYVLVEECCTERRFQIVSVIPSDTRDAIEMTCVTAG